MQVNQRIIITQDNWKKITAGDRTPEIVKQIDQAAKVGYFHFEIPENCKKFLVSTIDFANNFYKRSDYRNIPKDNEFIDRKDAQCESIYSPQDKWNSTFPTTTASLANAMNELCIEILKVFLDHFSFKQEIHEVVTGGASSNKGNSSFFVHHYRSKMQQEGLAQHKDFGLLTLLFINKLGLKFQVADKWVDAEPIDGHFVVNIGRTFEILINDKNKLIAPIHRVIQCVEDRISFAVQIDNQSDSPIFQRKEGQISIFHPSARAYNGEIMKNGNYL